jgi:hypothetical protein
MNSRRNWLMKGCTTRQPRCPRHQVEQLESRQLLSAPPGGITDPLIKRIVDAEYTQDHGRLTRSDVLNLLNVVAGTEKAVFTNGVVSFQPVLVRDLHATVTAPELTDLRTLVKDARAWGMTPDVADLFEKTVNFSPANEYYQGQPLLATGRLGAGNLDTVLQDLVGKWFLGEDLPDFTLALQNAGVTASVQYETAQGQLFGPNGPSPNDIAQGVIGDCYFMSALGEVALQSPQTIQDMFIDNGDGTDTVRFYEYDATNNFWQADYVTVNLELPVRQANGKFVFADRNQDGTPITYGDKNAILWPALAEKAYAQLVAEGWSRAPTSKGTGGTGDGGTPNLKDADSYDMLNNSNGPTAIQQLGASRSKHGGTLATASPAAEAALVQAFNHGTLVLMDTAEHICMLTAVVTAADPANDQFTILNPYETIGGGGDRTRTFTWTQLQQSEFLYYNMVSPPAVAPWHAVVQNAADTGKNAGGQATAIQWFDNGKPIAGPEQAHEGDTITVTFNTSANSAGTQFSLVAYAAPNGKFDSGDVDHEQEWADTTSTYTAAGSQSLSVTLPNGYFQLDFVIGSAIADFATGQRYASSVYIAGTTGGDHVV